MHYIKIQYLVHINFPDRNIYRKQWCDCRAVPHKDRKFPQTTEAREQLSSIYAFIQILSLSVFKTVILHKPLTRSSLCPPASAESNGGEAASPAFVPLHGGGASTARSQGRHTLKHRPQPESKLSIKRMKAGGMSSVED